MSEQLVFLIPILCWIIIYSVRRWLPAVWSPLTRWPSAESPASHALQGLPSALLGAGLAWLSSPEGSVESALLGALLGALAPIGHHVLRLLPGPYQGALRDAAWRAASKAEKWAAAKDAGKVGVLLLLLSGCTSTLTPAQQVERQACLAHVELTWDRRADALCPPGEVYWDDCEHAETLEKQLADAQRACSEEVRK